ncbi:MAG: choice-of-anchor A family protein [Acidobacteriota bacterium]
MKKSCFYPVFLLLFFLLNCKNNAQDNCDLSGFVTFSKTEWSADANGNNAGTARDIYFLQAFPQGLVVGGTFTIKLSSSKSTAAFLKRNDAPGKLIRSYTDPLSTESGLLGINMVALQLNIAADGLSPAKKTIKLPELVITQGKFQGKTVAEFFSLANQALGGKDISGSGYSYSELNDVATKINGNFNNGEVNNGFLACQSNAPAPKASLGDKIWKDDNNNGIQDAGESGFADIKVELHDCSGVLLRETKTDSEGRYLFTDLLQGSYFVKIVTPDGYVTGKLNQGSDDAADSDFKPDGQTDCFTFDASSDNKTIDAALVKTSGTDIQVTNSSDKTHVECGESFTFTVNVKNTGSLKANSVVISNVVSQGTVYVSSNASNGTYNPATGEWALGSLDAGQTAALSIQVKPDCAKPNGNSSDLGAAKGFNVFVLENMNHPYSNVQGKVAVGGDASLSSYSVGECVTADNSDVLIVGGNLNFTSGTVKNGNVVYGGTTNLPQSAVSITGGTLKQGHPLDFVAAKSYLQNLSVSLSGKSANGTAQAQWGGLTIKGSDPLLNIFNVTGSEFSSATYFIINVPEGSSILMNVNGTTLSWSGGMSLIGAPQNKVIYNFPQAQTLKIQGVNAKGSILAPFAATEFQYGIVDGQMIVKSISGSGQFNNVLWESVLTEPGNTSENHSYTSTASLAACDPADINPGNNSSSVTVYTGSASQVNDISLPVNFTLDQNYPNPFNPSTTIGFAVPEAGKYTLKIFNMLGQEISTLLNRDLSAGYHKAIFDASKIPSGIYFYMLEGNNIHLIRKMIFVK